ncbi:hypothetical protein [Streptomyces sp. NPDC086777]|uniref:hypothetical protein n=1 Tax=Streptomyces sp. NPDC086777 TaxID=3154866 RepID=UPI003450A194
MPGVVVDQHDGLPETVPFGRREVGDGLPAHEDDPPAVQGIAGEQGEVRTQRGRVRGQALGEHVEAGEQGHGEPVPGPLVPGREVLRQQVEHSGLALVPPVQQDAGHPLDGIGARPVEAEDHLLCVRIEGGDRT